MIQQNAEQASQRRPIIEPMVVPRQTAKQQPHQQQNPEMVRVPASLLQQMQQRMSQMEAVIKAQAEQAQQPVAKTYDAGQVQILMCCETITQLIEEFDLAPQKAQRLVMAKNYLLILSDLREFIPQQPQEGQQDVPQEEELVQEQPTEDRFFEENEVNSEEQMLESYPGELTENTKETLETITKKMAEIRKEEAVIKKEKEKTGVEKIKDFIKGKKDVKAEPVDPESEKKPKGIVEGMG